MVSSPLHCDRCRTPLPDAFLNTPEPVPCPGCHAPLLARVFPAFARGGITPGRTAESVGSDEDASCFFHPRKKAVVPCARCGRFLCALCDLEIDGRHLCPTCVADPAAGGTTPGATGRTVFANERTLYDQVALSLAVLPLFDVAADVVLRAGGVFISRCGTGTHPNRGSSDGPGPAGDGGVVRAGGDGRWGAFGYYALVAHTRIPF